MTFIIKLLGRKEVNYFKIEGEHNSHLDFEGRKDGNRKNCKRSITLQTSEGALEIETSSNCNMIIRHEPVNI